MNRQSAPSPSLASPLWWAAAVGLVLYAAVYLYNLRQGWQRELNVEIARIRAAGEPVTVEDLFEFFAPSEEALAAGEEWLAACAFLETDEYEAMTEGVPLVGKVSDSLRDQVYQWELGGEFPALEPTRALLARFEHEIDRLGEIARSNDQIAFELRWRDEHPVTLDQIAIRRTFARLMVLRAAVARAEQDHDGAIRAIEAMLSLTEGMGGEPDVVSQLVNFSIEGMAWQALSRELVKPQLPDARLAELQQALSSRDFLAGLRSSLVAERATSLAVLLRSDARAALFEGADFSPWSWALRKPLWRFCEPISASTYLAHMSDAISTLGDEPLAAMRALDAAATEYEAQAKTGFLRSLAFEPSLKVGPGAHYYLGAAYRFAAGARAAAAGCAVGRWRLAEGDWPESLEQVAERYGPLDLADPFSAGPLRYRIHDRGCLIYSVGTNGTDDTWPLSPRGFYFDDVVFHVGERPPIAPIEEEPYEDYEYE